jgi:hypothetical protein
MKLVDKPVISRQVMARELGGEIVILDLTSGNYFGLDEVGARIWKLIGEGKTLGETLDILLAEYEVERPQLEADLLGLVERLEAQGLVSAPAKG